MEKVPKILVADDDQRIRQLMQDMLEIKGYEVILAENGKEAIQKAGEENPDVILLDVKMPQMNGFEAAERIKADPATDLIPIVMVTGMGDLEHRVKAMDVGIDDFLVKPIEPSELLARVRSLVKVKAYNQYMRDHQKELEAKVAERTRQLQKALEENKIASLESIHLLSRAAEFKDPETGFHIMRMSRYCMTIAGRLGLSSRTCEAVLYAAPMHDVGKIGIPDRILLKPGKLTNDEWGLMKQHTTFGVSILAGPKVGFVRLAQVIAATHHEKWDGSGYPRGLKGKKIPLVGRIAAIADVFDALTTKRPYKEPYPWVKSLTIIREEKGRHFDPEVVEAFLAVKEEILAVKERFGDEKESLLVEMAGLAEGGM